MSPKICKKFLKLAYLEHLDSCKASQEWRSKLSSLFLQPLLLGLDSIHVADSPYSSEILDFQFGRIYISIVIWWASGMHGN